MQFYHLRFFWFVVCMYKSVESGVVSERSLFHGRHSTINHSFFNFVSVPDCWIHQAMAVGVIFLVLGDELGHDGFVIFFLAGSVQHSRMSDQGGINVSVSVGVFLVPLDGAFQSLFPGPLFLPAQLVQFIGVDGVSQVVELTVGHKGDPLFFLAFASKRLEQRAGDFDVGEFVLSSNIVDLPDLSLVQNDIKGTGDVLDKQKVACVGTVSVDGEGKIFQELVGKLGNQLFGELVRSVDVVTTGNQAGQFERSKVGFDQKFRSRFGSCIGVGGFQDVFFRHGIGVEIFSFSVNFISGDVNESFDGGAIFGRFQEHMGPVNVGLSKGKGVSKRIVHVGLRCKMHNGVDLFFAQHIRDQIGRSNVPLDKFKVGQIRQFFQVGQTGAIIQIVVHHNFVLRVLGAEEDGHVRGNETCK